MIRYVILLITGHSLLDFEIWQAFSLAFVTLFHITAGDPWPEEPALYDKDGTVNWKVGVFHMAYEISVGWVILQVGTHLPRKCYWIVDDCFVWMGAAGECGGTA